MTTPTEKNEETVMLTITELPEPEGFSDGVSLFRIDGVEVLADLLDNRIMFLAEVTEILEELAEDDETTTKQSEALYLVVSFLNKFVE